MHNREFKFGYQHFLLCQKSFLKVSSKWLLKNKSDNGKLLLGKTYSGERFRAILALLFLFFLTLSMQISESVDSDGTRNGQPPQILGVIGHPRYNEFSVLTNFVLTGFHCILLCMLFLSYQRRDFSETSYKYSSALQAMLIVFWLWLKKFFKRNGSLMHMSPF